MVSRWEAVIGAATAKQAQTRVQTMTRPHKPHLLIIVVLAAAFPAGGASAQIPAAIAAAGATPVATFHAEGAQIYECKAGADGKLGWVFREPIATLLLDGKTVGRHYAGPTGRMPMAAPSSAK